MAKDQTKRIRPGILKEDRDALSAIKGYAAPVYKPANDNYTLEKLVAIQAAMVTARELEVQAQAAADAARDAAVAKEWAFHNAMLEAKTQVKAQYGADSNEYAGLGLIKKSERESPSRTFAPPTT